MALSATDPLTLDERVNFQVLVVTPAQRRLIVLSGGRGGRLPLKSRIDVEDAR